MEINSKQDRLKKTIDFLKFKNLINSQKELASKIDINANSLSQAVSGNTRYLTDNLFKKIYIKFQILNLEWLLKGVGEIENQKLTQQSLEPNTINSLDSFSPDDILDYIIVNKEKFRLEPKVDAVVALFSNFEQQRVLQQAYNKAAEVNNLIEELKKKNGL
ncbi:hypothetical protein [Tenacibaculum sp. 190524A05c]|uniref:hypothetical protein n=1 Tax=Tenacibaculum platacis TaxID=3137852 RepID=UPI0031FB5C52